VMHRIPFDRGELCRKHTRIQVTHSRSLVSRRWAMGCGYFGITVRPRLDCMYSPA
jgi:hypothetical protein